MKQWTQRKFSCSAQKNCIRTDELKIKVFPRLPLIIARNVPQNVIPQKTDDKEKKQKAAGMNVTRTKQFNSTKHHKLHSKLLWCSYAMIYYCYVTLHDSTCESAGLERCRSDHKLHSRLICTGCRRTGEDSGPMLYSLCHRSTGRSSPSWPPAPFLRRHISYCNYLNRIKTEKVKCTHL